VAVAGEPALENVPRVGREEDVDLVASERCAKKVEVERVIIDDDQADGMA
jgi:hypothetical protein